MTRRRFIALAGLAAGLVVAALVGVVVLTQGSSPTTINVYTARLHYGEEAAFKKFAKRTGYDVRLFGGSGPDLNERLKAEGKLTQADVLITVDAANLSEAKSEGLLRPTRSKVLERNVPERLQDPGDEWFGLTTRARTIMRSTKRVSARAAPQTYEALGDPRWRGRICLRTSDSVYNSSFVADRIAKFGRPATERMLRRWFANKPRILGADVDVLNAIAAGQCDVGLTNTYYLGRKLAVDPSFPVAAVFADQQGRGAHVNLSGYGVTRYAKHPGPARKLVEYLSTPAAQTMFATTNSEFPANPRAKVPAFIRRWEGNRFDPIDVQRTPALEDDAVALMNEVGWR